MMMEFAGENFLNMKAPPNYRAGAGRGAVPFSTEKVDSNLNMKRPVQKPVKVDTHQFDDAEEDVFELIDLKRKKRRNIPKQNKKMITPKPQISIEEWIKMPNATDSTKRNKRLREEQQQTMRFYNVSEKLALTQEEVKFAELDRQRVILLKKISVNKKDDNSYIQLCDILFELEGISSAKKIILSGIQEVKSEKLYLKLLELHKKVGSNDVSEIARRACEKFPNSESLWLERVQSAVTKADKVLIVHEALINCIKSVKLWKLAADLETDKSIKQRVLDTAIDLGVEFPTEPIGENNTISHSVTVKPNKTKDEDISISEKQEQRKACIKSLEPGETLETIEFSSIFSKPHIVQRAYLLRKTREAPHNIQLWKHLIELEVKTNKPIEHILSEALKHNPQSVIIWLLHLKHSDNTKLKHNFGLALKSTNNAQEIVDFGKTHNII